MSSSTSPVPDLEPSRRARARSSFGRWLDRTTSGNRLAQKLLALPLVAALVTVVIMLEMAGFLDPTYYREPASSDLSDGIGPDLFLLMMFVYNLLPAVALAVLISVAARHLPRGLPVVAAAAVIFTAASIYLLVTTITDESSTAALGLLVYPVMLVLLLVPFAGVAALVHHRRAPRRSP